MAKIFISYRREDSRYETGAIQARLRSLLPRDEIYFDVDSIPLGRSFRKHLEGAVGECNYVIAIVGRSWENACDENGRRRLDNPNDWVRIEIETALARDIPVIPVLLDKVAMPDPAMLPDGLKEFSEACCMGVRPHPDFDNDIQKISRAIQKQESQRKAQGSSRARPAKPRAQWQRPSWLHMPQLPSLQGPRMPRLPSLPRPRMPQLPRLPRKPLLYVGVAIALAVAGGVFDCQAGVRNR